MIESLTTPMTEPALDVRSLTVAYGPQVVLREVSLTIQSRQFWFFIGPNGSGKSTLVKAILGAIRPVSGRMELAPELTHDSIGFVPQRCDLNRTLPTTVREFAGLGMVGLRAADREERLAWALERTGMSGLARADYWSLSGGQRQRALVARALVRRPKLLLADEPTNGLDPGAEEAILDSLQELNREGLTVVFVTHELGIAFRHGSHVALFHQGKITSGLREEILKADVLNRTFGTHLSEETWRSQTHIGGPHR
jgi:ABC-type Mn2+/Zn2+ transport system ATPase subunit